MPSLQPHPALPCPLPLKIRVEACQTATGLTLSWHLEGEVGSLALPEPQPPGPADALWKHTCLEAFLMAGDGRYREFNFAPSGLWAVYDFSAYRQRNDAWTPSANPEIVRPHHSPERLEMTAFLPTALLPGGGLMLGLTAVIETKDGHLSYWALRHPGPKPDFHYLGGMILDLPLPTPDSRLSTLD